LAKVGDEIRRVEVEALRYVVRFEREKGRDPQEVSRQGCDIISSGRKIEVKGKGAPGWNGSARLTPQSYDVMIKESADFYLYVVANIDSGDPQTYELFILGKKDILAKGAQWRGPWVVTVPRRERERYRVRTGDGNRV